MGSLFRSIGVFIFTLIFILGQTKPSSDLPSPLPPCLDATPTLADNSQSELMSEPLLLTKIIGPGTASDAYGAHGDLAIPFFLENCATGILLGDTFKEGLPSKGSRRSPVMLRTTAMPVPGQSLPFDSAAGIDGPGIAPHIVVDENGLIPTDGIGFPGTGDQIISYMRIHTWTPHIPHNEWRTVSSGLAWSQDGNRFYRMGPEWPNDDQNSSPFQMMSMQRSGEYVYVVSVRAGRQYGPMMLQRVPWYSMLEPETWECRSGDEWTMDYRACLPILSGSFGEPSLRLLADGKWVLTYLTLGYSDGPRIVTRWSTSPIGDWSPEKAQLTKRQYPKPFYGGFPHPRSTSNNMLFMVSTWVRGEQYDVSLLKGSL